MVLAAHMVLAALGAHTALQGVLPGVLPARLARLALLVLPVLRVPLPQRLLG